VRGEEALDIVGTAFPELSERGDVQTRALSTGERQLLGLAQAFVRRPDVLLIDDLGLALSAEAADRMVEGLARLRDEGAAVLLVDQSSDLVLDLVDRACWLEGGRLQFDGAPAELGARDDLLRPVFLSAQEIAT
jgi:branched-chain amino acid transport system ATP-binding protein